MVAWILVLMISLQPRAPWRDSYEDTATAIAAVVENEKPLFAGPDAKERTAALLIALSWAESRFDPKAVGDHGHSVGLYQIFHTNLPTPEGFRRGDILGNPSHATSVAIRMLRQSMGVCARRPVGEQLGWYASGDGQCEKGLSESRIFKQHPPKDTKVVLTPAPAATAVNASVSANVP
jgi:Transglycosylase SLT domain